MAHFARIVDGVVREVIVVNNDELLDDKGKESEAKGISFCRLLFGADTEWAQTSYNGNKIGGKDRGPYAGVGFTWDGKRFAPPTSPEPPASPEVAP